MSGANERRSAERSVLFTEASLEGLDVSRTDVRITDISTTGVFVDTRAAQPVGARARLAFHLGDRPIAVGVQVRYAIPSIGLGLSFTDLSAEDRQAIEEFLAKLAQGRV